MTNAVPGAGQFNLVGYVDARFDAYRPEYEAAIRSVGIQEGCHILDAGCGGGGYIPWMADIVGSSGQITALDISPESIESLNQRLDEWQLPCKVDTKVGSFLDLPFPDDIFDAVWCANATENYGIDELSRILNQFQRVVKPGGIVALKQSDSSSMHMFPLDPPFQWRRFEARIRSQDNPHTIATLMKTRNLRRLFEHVGFKDVWQKSFVIERWAPLQPNERQFISEIIDFFAKDAQEYDLSAEDLERWRKVEDPASPENPINDPDFYWSETQTVAVGRVV